MVIKIEGKSTLKTLQERVIAEGKKTKLTVPFLADGFKSVKSPTQPDGITPIVVGKANLIKSEVKKEIKEVKVETKVYTKKELESMTFTELKVIGNTFGTTDRSKDNLIKEILKLQK